jgi:calcium/calmodulin-dependent protein kinase kinase 2
LSIVRTYFSQLIEVHAQGIAHRDIKPDNLLLDANDVLKIVDFGVSEMFTKEDDRLKSSSGTPAFSSPELSYAGFNNVSGKAADIWAMGITLYALIYGYLPFNDQNVLELYENIRHQEYVSSRTFLIKGC